jgi:hypothetical protein
MEQGQKIRELVEVQLFEVSATVVPANAATEVISLRGTPVEAPAPDPVAESYRLYFDTLGMGEAPVVPLVEHIDRLLARLGA